MDGKDYCVTVKVQNGRILRLMHQAGFTSALQLAKTADVGPSVVGMVLAMKKSPLRRNGEYGEAILRIAAALRCNPDDMFNERQRAAVLQTNTATIDMNEAQIVGVMTCDGGEEAVWAKLQVDRLLGTLNSREANVLRLRMDGATLDEVADELTVTRERIRQIEQKALRRLKHPSRWTPMMPI